MSIVFSLPLEGGGAGVGVRTLRGTDVALEAAPPPMGFHQRPAPTPIPALPPSRGKGDHC